MRVQVLRVQIPAMSTLGYGRGLDESGNKVEFVGDHRPMRHLGEEIEAATERGEEAPWADLEDWQVR